MKENGSFILQIQIEYSVFCCKLFNVISFTSKIGNEGSRDQRNLSTKLKSHEISDEHIINMNDY